MDRSSHVRHVPYYETRVALVDQYTWPEKDSTERVGANGVSHPCYACNGDISRTLPLNDWPKVNEVHPQVRMSSQPHFMARDPYVARQIEQEQLDLARKRIEGFYVQGGSYDPYRIRENQIQSIIEAKRRSGR